MKICIFGASSDRLDRFYFDAAYELGKKLAEAGHSIVFGAGSSGLMGACAKGALQNGGHVIGIAPSLFNEPGFLLHECSEIILTSSLAERKEEMMKCSDGIIALPGGIGTMDEFFEAITLKQLGLISSPLVILNTDHFYNPLYDYLCKMADLGFMSENCLRLIRVCDTPEEALSSVLTPDNLKGSIRRLQDYNK